MTSRKILTIVDLPGSELDDTGLGLLSYCTRLAGFIEATWGAVTMIEPVDETVASFGAYGTPAVKFIDGGASLLDTPVSLGLNLAQLIRDEAANLVVLPHNDLGVTLAPVLAAALDAALFTEVYSARQVDGVLHLSRSALGGRISESRSWEGKQPLVITVPLRSLSRILLPNVRACTPSVSCWKSGDCPADIPVAKVISRIPPDPQTVDLTDAEVIFSAGKGCDEAVYAQLQELCQLLNVSFGVTRPVYDLGWCGFERMVGQTGRTVTPRFYLALGISGSMHHLGGIKDSKRIVAINNDAKAPIFPNSDDGFVADLGELVPRLLDRARSVCGGEK